jgi:glycosyltransferase involved in cell wall biosynthesis
MIKIINKLKSADALRKKEGALFLLITTLQRMEMKRRRRSNKKKTKVAFLAKYEDIQKADWSSKPYKPPKASAKEPYRVNWVMSPPGKGLGGGHQNLFRFIDYLERQDHSCHIYLYSDLHYQSADEARAVILSAYPDSRTQVEWLNGPMQPADAVFATGWETAYPVFNDRGKARKFYFVQDFEPYFHPIGSEYVLAENTYRMNLYGITAGGWLSKKLSQDYGMPCDHYDFGTDANMYRFENENRRKEVFFYARPVTSRRGFEIGVMALEIFHRMMPDYTINLAGWDVSEYDIPFPYNNLKALRLDQLSDLYNRSAAALVISLTNMSLLPLELLSCGVIPVMNKGENNSLVSDNPYIKYTEPSPMALATALANVVKQKDLPAQAKKASQSVSQLSWDQSGRQFEKILIREING